MIGLLQKAKNQRGVTIIYALVFLAVAATVSAIVLSSSVSMVKTLHDKEAHEQDRLTLQSAAEFVRDCFCDDDGNPRMSFKVVTVATTVDGETTKSSTVEPADVETGDGPLDKFVEKAMKRAVGETTLSGKPEMANEVLTMELTGDGVPPELADAVITIDMKLHDMNYTSGDSAGSSVDELMDAVESGNGNSSSPNENYLIEAKIMLSHAVDAEGEQMLYLTAYRGGQAPDPTTEGNVSTVEDTVAWRGVQISTIGWD